MELKEDADRVCALHVQIPYLGKRNERTKLRPKPDGERDPPGLVPEPIGRITYHLTDACEEKTVRRIHRVSFIESYIRKTTVCIGVLCAAL